LITSSIFIFKGATQNLQEKKSINQMEKLIENITETFATMLANQSALQFNEIEIVESIQKYYKKRSYLTEKQDLLLFELHHQLQQKLDFLENEKRRVIELPDYFLMNTDVKYYKFDGGVHIAYYTRVCEQSTMKYAIFTDENRFDFGRVINLEKRSDNSTDEDEARLKEVLKVHGFQSKKIRM
jgi:hypothetical protein